MGGLIQTANGDQKPKSHLSFKIPTNYFVSLGSFMQKNRCRTPASAAILSRRVGVVFEYSKTMTKKLSVACD